MGLFQPWQSDKSRVLLFVLCRPAVQVFALSLALGRQERGRGRRIEGTSSGIRPRQFDMAGFDKTTEWDATRGARKQEGRSCRRLRKRCSTGSTDRPPATGAGGLVQCGWPLIGMSQVSGPFRLSRVGAV
ncbi:hypothetical protein QBC39DRAFT_358651 [Podospora conica]|nr:hypothetical protein QBC39DRAFT_358651 [Schizothecium conicum]